LTSCLTALGAKRVELQRELDALPRVDYARRRAQPVRDLARHAGNPGTLELVLSVREENLRDRLVEVGVVPEIAAQVALEYVSAVVGPVIT